MPAEPVTREAVERWLKAHGWIVKPSTVQRATWATWRHSASGVPIIVDDDSVALGHTPFDYSDLLLTEDGIYGRIA